MSQPGHGTELLRLTQEALMEKSALWLPLLQEPPTPFPSETTHLAWLKRSTHCARSGRPCTRPGRRTVLSRRCSSRRRCCSCRCGRSQGPSAPRHKLEHSRMDP